MTAKLPGRVQTFSCVRCTVSFEWVVTPGRRKQYCDPCRTVRSTERRLTWQRNNKELIARQSAARYAADPEKFLGDRKKKICRKHGITPGRYDELLVSQGGGCAICSVLPGEDERLHIDHDHACCPRKNSCGKCVRGLLCRPCNTAIGLLKEDPKLLTAAIKYISPAV